MKRFLFFMITVICFPSCTNLIGGGEVQVSGKEFTVASTGGEVDITTSGVIDCTLKEPDKASDSVHLKLRKAHPVTYNGPWYSFESKNDGKELHLHFEENATSSDRVLYITLTELDLYTRITITQTGGKLNN